jgi:DNA mismatch repair protein MutL
MERGQIPEIQRLLLPSTIELTPQQKAIAEPILDVLNKNGFEVDWFGSSAVIVRGVPNLVKNIDPNLVLEDLLNEVNLLDESSNDQDQTLRRFQEKIAISMSCRAAIKINTPLTREKMQWLLDELFKCDNPFTCPHGRPIILKMGIEEILTGFKRI